MLIKYNISIKGIFKKYKGNIVFVFVSRIRYLHAHDFRNPMVLILSTGKEFVVKITHYVQIGQNQGRRKLNIHKSLTK